MPAGEREDAAQEPGSSEPVAPEPSGQEPAPPDGGGQEPAAEQPDEQQPDEQQPDEQQPGEAAPVADTTPDEDMAAVAAAEPAPDWIRGRLSARYWGRWSSGESDHKIFATLDLDIGDPEYHDVTGRFMGRAVINAKRSDSDFRGIIDTYDSDVVGFLYDAYADVHSFSALSRFRVGRQSLWDTPEVAFFDGLSLETAPIGELDLAFGAYGGASARLYESASGDWLAGAYAEGRPWDGGRLRLDYMHLEDDARLGQSSNDLIGIGYWQTIARAWQLEAEYTILEEESRDVRGRLAWSDPESALLLQVSYFQLLKTQGLLALEVDQYFEVLGSMFPYYQFGFLGSKGLGEHFDVQAGVDLRRVSDEGDVGAFNRDYERYFGNLGMHDLILEGFAVRLMTDLWYSDGNDVLSGGIDLSQQVSEKLAASIGTYYSLYKYDFFTTSERDNVRTYYAILRHDTTEDLDLELSYNYEDTDIGDFHWLRLGGVWRF